MFWKHLPGGGIICCEKTDWRGGEPTTGRYFEDCVNWIRNHKYRQRINTNAIIYSKAIAEALESKTGEVRISVDSGTSDGFYRMKGHKLYDMVWENIGRYCALGREVYIKYNVCNYNSDLNEIDAFLTSCREHGVIHIIVDAEVNSYQPVCNAGRFYFTEKELEAARYLYEQARKMGFESEVSPYAFTVREERDIDGKLVIPKTYYDNIDHDVLCNNIYVRTFASVMQMLESIKNSPDREIIVWGAGRYGKLIKNILNMNQIEISCFADADVTKQGGILGERVISTEELFGMDKQTIVLLAGTHWKEMLRKINQANYRKGEIYYMPEEYWDQYEKDIPKGTDSKKLSLY